MNDKTPDPQEKLIDARDLAPPEPLELVLSALDELKPGERLRLLIHTRPLPLYGILDRNGYAHSTEYLPDGTVEVLIWQK